MYDLTTLQLINLAAMTQKPINATKPTVIKSASLAVQALSKPNNDYLTTLNRLSKE